MTEAGPILRFGEGSPSTLCEGQGSDHQCVELWTQIYDAIYARNRTCADSSLNLAGWISSVDRKPFPPEQMRSWADDAVDRIRMLAPRRVLEIGCGTGLLLLRLVEHCETYWGTEISEVAIGYLRDTLRAAQDAGRRLCDVTLLKCPAHDFSQLEGYPFDTVVLNSVTQHFPSKSYLMTVLSRALDALPEHGRMYVGDVRSSDLVPALITTAEFQKAAPETPLSEFRKLVARAARLDRELKISPDFFRSLPARLPSVKAVEVQIKRTPYDNELSRFRYEVILHRSEPRRIPQQAMLEWSDARSLDGVARRLDQAPNELQVSSVPNSRIAPCVRLAGRVAHGGPGSTLEELLAELHESRAESVDPWSLVRIGRARGYCVELHACPADISLFHAVFHRAHDDAAARPIPVTSSR